MSPDELGRRAWELRGPLMRLACAIVRRQQDAEDAVSEAVVRAFETRRKNCGPAETNRVCPAGRRHRIDRDMAHSASKRGKRL